MKFKCSECGKTFPHGNLAHQSVAISDQETPQEALGVLDAYDVVCQGCYDLIEGSVDRETGAGSSGSALSNLQGWWYSGLHLDRVQLEWLNLNY